MTDELYPAIPGGRVDAAAAAAMRTAAAADPDGFWRGEVGRLDWLTPPTVMGDWSFDPVAIRWFPDGVLNASANCLDRHDPAGVAIVWEADDPATPPRRISYGDLLAETCRMANVLAGLGVTAGDRVTIYLPMIPEAVVAMLACARLGAVHSVVFAGFSPEAIAGRIVDAGSRVVITADAGKRGGKSLPLKTAIDAACDIAAIVETVVVIRHGGGETAMRAGRDRWWHDLREDAADVSQPAAMNAEDPLFLLYTSGSTGTPKGVVHTTGGYLLWANFTFDLVFDYRPGETFWCTADVGWVTGHSYSVYGPLSAGATILLFEGVPTWPASDRFWAVVERHKVNAFYTAPTAIRALMRDGDAPVLAHDLTSLRLLGSVGEPINPEAWGWYHRVVGGGKLPIVDTWWQTETGGILISPLPYATDLKPGSATLPLPGVAPALVDAEGRMLADDGAAEGNLVLTTSWPGQARTLFGDHDRFVQTYFTTYPGMYFTGDGARRDADGYWWITGRVDDVINVSGHRLGTAEIESALVAHQHVAEAAVVGFPHEIKGQGIYAYVTLNAGIAESDAITAELRQHVRTVIGPIATPDRLHLTPALPKTRSGKIMRRILRKIAEGQFDTLGDTSTLADASVVDALIAGRKT